MARTYDTAKLALNDPSDADWALAYARFALRDKPNEANAYPAGSLQDEELNALLEADKVTDTTDGGGDGTAYYRPHLVAASLIESTPEWVERFSAGGYSESVRSALEVASGVRKAGRWIDDSINDSTSGRVGARSLRLRT